MIIIFDTNVLFSATGWHGTPYDCVEQARMGKVQAVTCIELMNELAEKLETKLRFSGEGTAETLADYLSFIRVVKISKTLGAICRDPDDNVTIECAIAGGAQFLVTGDKDLLVLKRYEQIEMISPAEFMVKVASLGTEL